MNRIFFVRHGKNPANTLRIFSHKKVDYSLSEEGIAQAEACRRFFESMTVDAVFTSTLKRAIETGKIIGSSRNLEAKAMDKCLEIDAGYLEGKTIDTENLAFYHEVIDDWFSGNRERTYPGGENFNSLFNRFIDGLKKITLGRENRNIVVVSHYGVLTSVLPWLCGNISPVSFHNTKDGSTMPNCAITEITIETNGSQVEGILDKWSFTGHLN